MYCSYVTSHCAKPCVDLCTRVCRQNLYGNVVVTGGNTLLQGVPERLNRDLARKTQPVSQ